jgi:hypothetical protein
MSETFCKSQVTGKLQKQKQHSEKSNAEKNKKDDNFSSFDYTSTFIHMCGPIRPIYLRFLARYMYS